MPPRAILSLMEADRRRLLRDGLMAWMMILPLVMAAAARAGLPELVLVLEGRGIMIGPGFRSCEPWPSRSSSPS